MIAMRRTMLAVALISFTWVMPATYAHADLPVIDVTAIADAVKAYALQIQQLATEIETWVTYLHRQQFRVYAIAAARQCRCRLQGRAQQALFRSGRA
jgi:hypothetical protein